MDNSTIAGNFSLLSKLMDIHGENSFKVKSYSIAAFTIDILSVQLKNIAEDKIFAIKGIGEAIGKKILQQLNTGELPLLNEYLQKTPPGILEMLHIKGIGPKKIATIWKELEIETIGELLYACQENRLLLYKGFGEKTQQQIMDSLEFYLNNQGSHLFAEIETYAEALNEKFTGSFIGHQFLITGNLRRHSEVVDHLQWVTTVPSEELKDFLEKDGFITIENTTHQSQFTSPENILVVFFHCDEADLFWKQFITTGSADFLEEWQQQFPKEASQQFSSEKAIFEHAGINYIPPFLREKPEVLSREIPEVVQVSDIKGIIHTHSTWSDGINSIEEMAQGAIEQGFEYLVISDHSKSAYYAKGLYEERLIAQHAEIDELNLKLSPFKIFKSIESDILNDGNLDYTSSVLENFDVVIASIHSNLKMTEEKAMMRLLKAIENPYTNILGHMTGRLLLSRNGYPVDHKKIIDACAANNVAIELNAHPRRLDMDWRWIDQALEKNVLISINPDAHSIKGYKNIRYGVLAAQKGGVTKQQNLSSFSLKEFEEFVSVQKDKR